MIRNRSLLPSRRSFLIGAGACVALPWLPSIGTARAAGSKPRRFIAMYLPNGVHVPAWHPGQLGPDYTLSPILSSFAEVKSDLLVLSGLQQLPGESQGGGDHASGTGAFLTSVKVKKSLTDIVAGISVDQVIAEHQQQPTAFKSLQVGIEGGGNEGNCDGPGYACAYMRNISWASPTQPLPKVIQPRVLFDLLFPMTGPASAQAKARRKSVLDYVRRQATELEPRLARADRAKLDEYLTGVRELEQRIDHDSAMCSAANARPEDGIGVPARIKAMMDLMVLAFQCDQTRVLTFMMGNGGSYRSYAHIGIAEGHHDLSHHLGDPDKQAKLQQINTWEVEQIAYFVKKLKAIPEGEGSLLDNTVLFCSSEITDGNAHDHTNVPLFLAGGLGNQIKTGTHIRFSGGESVGSLFKTILHTNGITVDRFGDDGDQLLTGILR